MDPGKLAVAISALTLTLLIMGAAFLNTEQGGPLPVTVMLALLQVLFLTSYCQWSAGLVHPSGDGVVVLSMITVLISGFFLALYNGLAYNGLAVVLPMPTLLMCVATCLALLQYQCCQLATFQRMSTAHLPMNSADADAARPQLRTVAAELKTAASQRSIDALGKAAKRLSKAVGRYREKHMIVVGTSIFSICSVGVNLLKGLPNSNDPYFDTSPAKIALVIGIGACLNSLSSLLHDRGFHRFPQDRSMRMSVACKTCLFLSKVCLTYQLTWRPDSAATDDWTFYVLVISTLTSFMTAVVLTFPKGNVDTIEILISKGQIHSRSIVHVARLLWISTHLGSVVFIIETASGSMTCEAIVNHGGPQPRTILAPYLVGFGFVAGAALANEVAVLGEDAKTNFSAAHSAAGLRMLAVFAMVGVGGNVLIGMVFDWPLIDESGRRHTSCFFGIWFYCLIAIWFSAVSLLCIVRKTPLPREGFVPLLKETLETSSLPTP